MTLEDMVNQASKWQNASGAFPLPAYPPVAHVLLRLDIWQVTRRKIKKGRWLFLFANVSPGR